MQRIYLNHQLAAPLRKTTVDAMLPYLTTQWGVPGMPQQMGQDMLPAMEEAYRALYALAEMDPDRDNFILTSSGAESVNHVLFATYMDLVRHSGKTHWMTSNVDEAPVIMGMERYQPLGCVSKLIPVNEEGIVTPQAVIEAITPRTILLSLSWANALTGVIHPIHEIAELCHDRGIYLHLDVTHVLGKIFLDIENIRPHLLSFNGEQLHAPKGVGGLFLRQGTPLGSFLSGGQDQAGQRAGTVNVPGLIALGKAAQDLEEQRDILCMEGSRLRNALEEGICAGFPEAVVFFRDSQRLPTVSTIAFPGVANDALLYALDQEGVIASFGGGGFQQIALVLKASGVEASLAQSALSFSLSFTTTEEEIDEAVERIIRIAKRLRTISGALVTSS